MSLFASASRLLTPCFLLLGFCSSSALALDLDWHGQFRAESNMIFGYTHGVTTGNGYTIPLLGDSPATFQNLFFRLDPRVLVNDNVTIHSDIWFGAPDTGFFGSSALPTNQTFNYFTTNTGNSAVTARNFYAQVATDFGTFRIGRVPLQWGLGMIWSSGDLNSFDRFPSSGDAISLETKLGAFKFMPSIVKYQDHNLSNVNTTRYGNSGVSDYTLGLTYSNDDEQIDLGVLFMRRVAGQNSNVIDPFTVGTAVSPATQPTLGYAYNIWDFTAAKKAGMFLFRAEVPMVTGTVAGRTYSTVAGAIKADAQVSEKWKFKLNLGTADGQAGGADPASKLTAFYFHPDYRPGLLMFNYNLRNIATGTGSPYFNPITNARFLSLGADYTSNKWTHGFLGLYAVADKVASGVAGDVYFNQWNGYYQNQTTNGSAQDKNLGFEFDYRLGYDWDESIRFGWDLGFYFPGKFYDFADAATTNTHKTVFGTNLNMLVKF